MDATPSHEPIIACSTKMQQPQRALYRSHATATALAVSPEAFSDRAATSYGSEGRGFESLRARHVSADQGSFLSCEGQPISLA